MQSNEFNKIYNKIKDLNDDDILDEGVWSDLWHGSRAEKKSDQATKDAYLAYKLDKVTKKFEKDGLSPEDARKYAYRKVYGAPVQEDDEYGFQRWEDEPDRDDGHDINLLKAVAKQFAQDVESGDYTAIDDLLKDVPEAKLKGFLSELESIETLQSKAGMAETNISKLISHLRDREIKEDDSIDTTTETQVEEDFDKEHPDFPKAQAWTDEKDKVLAIIAKHPEAAETLAKEGDVFSVYDTDLYLDLFDHFAEEMPYGTQKGRDGDPVEYINDELDSMGILESAPMSEAKQKPYVSHYGGMWSVMDSEGEVVDQFKDKEQAFDYLEQWYDDLLNPRPVKLRLRPSASAQAYMDQMDASHAQIYGEGRKTYFHKGDKEFKLIPEGYKKTKNGMITKVLK